MRPYSNMVGLGIYDVEKYTGSTFSNNLIYNMSAQRPVYDATEGDGFLHPESQDSTRTYALSNSEVGTTITIPISVENEIANFSQVQSLPISASAKSVENDPNSPVTFNAAEFSAFDSQDKYGTLVISDDSLGVTLTGNSWKKIPFNYTLNESSVLNLSLSSSGTGEIIGIGLETDNTISPARTFQFLGSQNWGIRNFSANDNATTDLTIPVGDYITGNVTYLIFAVDNDAEKDIEVTFRNLTLTQSESPNAATTQSATNVNIVVGQHNDD